MVKDLEGQVKREGGGALRLGKKVFVCLWYEGDCSLFFNYELGISSG